MKLKLTNVEITSIAEIEGLKSLINLKELDLSENLITEIQGLETLVRLEWLFLSYNQITTIQGLESLIQLKRLDLAYNQITTIQGLETLVRLEGLYLSNNQITTIQGLDTLIQLQSIRIDDNLLPSFFSNYGTTDYLHFSRYLQKWRPAQFLDQLQQNHFDERVKYNYKLFTLIPYLEEQAQAIKTEAAREFCDWVIISHKLDLNSEYSLLL